jgi:Predicted transcriptional regulators
MTLCYGLSLKHLGGLLDMKTIKEVSDLSGISIRMLHHYDKIGLLKPDSYTNSGYRLYSDSSLITLQQILFFKELGIPLGQIKTILSSNRYNEIELLQKQKALLEIKRNRINGLIDLINKRIDGDDSISFKEFNMDDYINTLEAFKNTNHDMLIHLFGSDQKYDRILDKIKTKKNRIAQMAILEFGSIENYSNAMNKNMLNIPAIENGMQEIRKNKDKYISSANELIEELMANIHLDPTSNEVQVIVRKIDTNAKETYKILHMEMGSNYFGFMANLYTARTEFQKIYDTKYGDGATQFIASAYEYYSKKEPDEQF